MLELGIVIRPQRSALAPGMMSRDDGCWTSDDLQTWPERFCGARTLVCENLTSTSFPFTPDEPPLLAEYRTLEILTAV